MPSYETVHDQLVSMVEAVTPPSVASPGHRGGPAQFTYVPDASEENPPKADRSFWLEWDQSQVAQADAAFGELWNIKAVTIVVVYKDRRHNQLNQLIPALDGEAIARHFLRPSNWGTRSTNGLDNIEDEFIITKEDRDGAVWQRIQLIVHYRSDT